MSADTSTGRTGQDLSHISEVKTTSEATEVNKNLELGWILLAVHQVVDSDGSAWTKFVLGWLRTNGEPQRPKYY